MKAEDLMIGDWVIEKDRVCRVSFNTTIEEVRKEDCATSASSSTRYDDIEPIPLTPEILEKNGFVLREGCTSAWDWHSGYYSVHISGNNEQIPMSLTIYVPSGHSPHGSSRLLNDYSFRYVHKFQHALRLCGIKKEIVL